MKTSLFTTLLALTTMTLMVMSVSSSGLRGLQSVNVENIVASIPSFKISGVSTLLQILNSASDFTNSEFDVITLDSFSQSTTEQGVVYEGKVTVANDQGVNITGLITGVWDPVDNKIVLTASKYEVDTEDSDSEGQSDVTDDNSDNSDNGNDNNTTADGYTILDIEVAKNDPNIAAIFDFSHEKLIETGERANKIPISNYTVTDWSYASYKNKTNGVYYKFVAKLLGDNYVHVDTNMTTFKYNNQTLFLAGYYYHAYNISKGALPNNFTEPENNNTNTTTPGDNNTTLPGDNNSTTPGDNSTLPGDNNNTTLPGDNNSTLPGDNNTTLPGDNNSTTPGDNSTLPGDNNNTTLPGDNNNTNSTNNTTPTNPTPVVPVGYTYISPEDLANNTKAQYALSFGVAALIQKGISQYKIPAASPEYNITNLILAAYKNTSTGNNFIFYTNLTNALNYKVDANITIQLRASSYKLAGYSFHSYGYPAGAIVIPPAQNNTNNSTNNTIPDNSTQPVDNSTIPDNSTQPVDNSTQPVDNSTLPVDNSTIPDNSTQPVDNSTIPDNSTQPVDNSTQPVDNNSTTNATEPANNNTTPVNNTAPQVTADGYTILSADQLANDSLAQSAVQYGAQALIQKALSQNKIPAANANYTINNIYFAGAKKQIIGTSYKFAVNMTNADYVHVDANLTVFYRYSTKALSLNGYWFRSYNYSASAISNNTTIVPPTNNTTSSSNSTVVDQNNNATVVDQNNNATVVDSGAAAPVDNSTVIDPAVPVAGDNSTVIDNGSASANAAAVSTN